MQSDSNTRYDSPPDTVLVSNDGVHFDVHCSRFPEFSGNNFGGLLAPPPDRTNARSIQLPEDSQIVNLILHVVYGVYFRPSSPSRQTLLATLRALHKYGIRPSFYVVPNSPIFDNLISDLLTVLFWPEWPAAALLLTIACKFMVFCIFFSPSPPCMLIK